jgi:hypothetical protein
MEQVIQSKQDKQDTKYITSRNVDILDVSLLENPIAYIFIIYNCENVKYNKINSITKRKGITYLNKKKIGKYLGTYNSNGKHHLYTNKTPNKATEPNQIIFLPKSKIDFKIYIRCLDVELSAKILYKHIC